MPIVIPRNGQKIPMPTADEETRKKLALAIFENYLKAHPEILQEEGGGSA